MDLQVGRAFEVKEVTEAGSIAGYGAVFGNIDHGGDVIHPGAFADSLESRGLPKMLWGHDLRAPAIGTWQAAKEDDHGLLMEGKFNLDMTMGRDVHSAVRSKSVDGLSIGYLEGDDTEYDKAGIRHLKSVELFEVSVVNFPMNEAARVSRVKQLILSGELTKTELERILRKVGLSATQAKGLIARGYDGLMNQRKVDDSADDLANTLRRLSNTLK